MHAGFLKTLVIVIVIVCPAEMPFITPELDPVIVVRTSVGALQTGSCKFSNANLPKWGKKSIGQGPQVVAHSPLTESMATLFLQRIIIGETKSINMNFFSYCTVSIFLTYQGSEFPIKMVLIVLIVRKLLTLNWVVGGVYSV